MKQEGKYKIDLVPKLVDGEDHIPFVDTTDLQRNIGEMLPDGFVLRIAKTVGKAMHWKWIQVDSEDIFFCEIERGSQAYRESNGITNRYYVYHIIIGYETNGLFGVFSRRKTLDAVCCDIAKMIEDKCEVKRSSLSLRDLYKTRQLQNYSIPIGNLRVDYEKEMVCGEGTITWEDGHSASNYESEQELFIMIPFNQIKGYDFYCDRVTYSDWDSQDCDGREHADIYGETMSVDGSCDELPPQAERVNKMLWDNVRFDLYYYLDGERMIGVPETNVGSLHYSRMEAFEAREKLKPLLKMLCDKRLHQP